MRVNAVTLKAHYDGKQVCLDEPCQLPPQTRLLVVVVPDTEGAFREDWFEMSRQNLPIREEADEPDYSDLLAHPAKNS